MKISILGVNYAPEKTGVAPYTTGLAKGLVARGHQVQVLTGYPHYPAWSIDRRYSGWKMSEEIDGVSVRRFRHHVPAKPNSKVRRILFEASYGVRLFTASWGKPDVILCVSPALIASAFAIARNHINRHRAPLGIIVQDLYSIGINEIDGAGTHKSKAARRFEARVVAGTDGVAVVHEGFKASLTNSLSVPARKIEVIRNWTHLRNSGPVNRAQIRSNNKWAEDEIVVLHAGNMGVKQGLDNVVDAAKRADGDPSKRVRFVLLGDGSQRVQLESSATGVESLTFIEQVPDAEFQGILAAADILLVNEKPGVAEMSIPSKLTSYLKTGRPVLAATSLDGTTATEVKRSGGGIVIESGNPQALLESAHCLGLDADRCRALGEAGKRYCDEVLGEAAAIDSYESWLVSLAASTNRVER